MFLTVVHSILKDFLLFLLLLQCAFGPFLSHGLPDHLPPTSRSLAAAFQFRIQSKSTFLLQTGSPVAFSVRSKNCEKRLLALSHISFCPHEKKLRSYCTDFHEA